MQAMVLAAGFGTRLRPYSLIRPKPLFPILNQPLLFILLNMLREAHATNIVVNCHHLGEQIEAALYGEPNVAVLRETEILGTGGGLRGALPLFEDAPLLVMNGDILHNVDLSALYDEHVRSGNAVTMAMHDYPRFNSVVVDGEQVVSFRRDEDTPPSSLLAYTGIQVVEPRIIEMIPPNSFHHIIDLYEELAGRGERIGVARVDHCYWRDIGTPKDYLQLHESLLVTGMGASFHSLPHNGSWCVDEKAELGRGVELSDWCAIGAGAHIGNGARLRRCVVWPGAEVEAGAFLEDTIIAPGRTKW